MSRKLTIAGLVIALVLTMTLVGCGKAKEAVDSARDVADGARQAADSARAAKELEDKGETTVKSDDGEVKVRKEDGETVEMTIEDEDGKKMTMTGGKSGDLSGLEIPVYPGAEQEGAHTMQTDDLDRITAQFTTDDSFETVASFYKDKLPGAEKTEISHGGQQTLILRVEEEKMDKSVTVVTDADEGNVVISLQQNRDTSKE
ncbi:MAG: hypothetical protein ACLFWB_07380 [Armatimonadota bacterium]